MTVLKKKRKEKYNNIGQHFSSQTFFIVSGPLYIQIIEDPKEHLFSGIYRYLS